MIDPDATLAQIRDLTGRIYAHWDGPETIQPGQMDGLACRLAELVEDLDEWLIRGGRPPTAWGRRS